METGGITTSSSNISLVGTLKACAAQFNRYLHMSLHETDIDPTGLVYGLVASEADCGNVFREYLEIGEFTYIPDEGDELPLTGDTLSDFLAGNPPYGMGRLKNGFLYVLKDRSIVIGLDGHVVDRSCLRRLNGDSRIVHLIAWGDQPPPENRMEFTKW